jgi:hypothetical protein
MVKRGMFAAVVLVLGGCLTSGPAGAAPATTSRSSTSISAAFVPDKLGAPATVELGFRLGQSGDGLPRPLVGVDFLMPAGVDLSTSELGLATCDRRTLVSAGAEGCQPEAVMGYGKAVILTPDAVEALVEPVGLTVVMAPPVDRQTTLLFYASGDSPVIAQMEFSGELGESSGVYGPEIGTTIPLIAGLPGEPDARVVRMHSSIGSKRLTYYKRVHGAKVAYTPKGMLVPHDCPVGGFPFAANFEYADGSRETVSTKVPCPSRSRRGHHRGGRSK